MPLKTKSSCTTITQFNLPTTYGTSNVWNNVVWGDSTDFQNVWGTHIWSDGDYYYYTENNQTYKLISSKWERHTWAGAHELPDGFGVWTDGQNIFYSGNHIQLTLLKNENRWVNTNWNSQTYPLESNFIWKDTYGNIYYSTVSRQYEYDQGSKRWVTDGRFTGQKFRGSDIWEHNGQTYRSYLDEQYRLSGNIWLPYSWSDVRILNGFHVWTDGSTYFYSYGDTQYKLIEPSVGEPHWEDMQWSGVTSFNGGYLWGDDKTIFNSIGSRGQYALTRERYTIINSIGQGVTILGDNPTAINSTESVTIQYRALSGYTLPDNVTPTNCQYTYEVNTDKTLASLRLSNPTGNIRIRVSGELIEYTIQYDLNGVEMITGDETIDVINVATAEFKSTSGELPSIDNVVVDNATISNWSTNNGIAVLELSNPTGNVVVHIYSVNQIIIKYETENCKGVNNPSTITNYYVGQKIPLTFKANEGYKFKTTPGELGGNIWLKNCSAGDVITYTESTFSFYITNLLGKEITVGCQAYGTEYSVTYNLNGVTPDANNPKGVDETDTNLTFKFRANIGYTLTDDVRVSNARLVSWDKSTGNMVLSNFTGNVIITVNAQKMSLDSALVLYQYGGMPNVVNKYLSEVGVLKGVFRDVASVTHLIVTIEYPKVPDFNYVWVQDFSRYYFVTNFSCHNQNIWELDLTIDVLMTYQDAIIRQKAFIDRSESHYNPMLPDDEVVVEEGCTFEVITVGNDVFATDGRNWGSDTPNVDTYQPMYVLSASNLNRS